MASAECVIAWIGRRIVRIVWKASRKASTTATAIPTPNQNSESRASFRDLLARVNHVLLIDVRIWPETSLIC